MNYFFWRLSQICIAIACVLFTSGTTAIAEDDLGALLGANDPILRITYTAGTKGELYACPTCGNNSLGGLARRSQLIKDFRNSSTPLIHLAGAEEFLSDLDRIRIAEAKGKPSDPKDIFNETEKAKRLVAAHTILKADAGWLLPEEKEWLETYAKSIPTGFETVTEPVSKVITTRAGTVAIVLFPLGTENFGVPSQKQIDTLLSKGKELASTANLVIGISPWGTKGELTFIPQAEGVYDILFGGGVGLGGPYVTGDSTRQLLWIRSETHGRAVNILNIFELPALSQTASWLEGVSFTAEQEFLYLRLPPDSVMEKTIGDRYESWWKE